MTAKESVPFQTSQSFDELLTHTVRWYLWSKYETEWNVALSSAHKCGKCDFAVSCHAACETWLSHVCLYPPILGGILMLIEGINSQKHRFFPAHVDWNCRFFKPGHLRFPLQRRPYLLLKQDTPTKRKDGREACINIFSVVEGRRMHVTWQGQVKDSDCVRGDQNGEFMWLMCNFDRQESDQNKDEEDRIDHTSYRMGPSFQGRRR